MAPAFASTPSRRHRRRTTAGFPTGDADSASRRRLTVRRLDTAPAGSMPVQSRRGQSLHRLGFCATGLVMLVVAFQTALSTAAATSTSGAEAGANSFGTHPARAATLGSMTARACRRAEEWLEECAELVAQGAGGCNKAAAVLQALEDDSQGSDGASGGPSAPATSTAAATKCDKQLLETQARVETMEGCCVERDELRTALRARVPETLASCLSRAGELKYEAVRAKAAAETNSKLIVEAEKNVSQLRRQLKSEDTHTTKYRALFTESSASVASLTRQLEEAEAARLALEETLDAWYMSGCYGCTALSVVGLVAAIVAWWRRRPLCALLFRPSLATTTFDLMLPSVEPLLVEDSERQGYLFACVPLRQLPPTGRGAPLADDGPNGTFMTKAVTTATKLGRRLVVVAYANVATPPNDVDTHETYARLCREACDEVEATDVVLVWHNRVVSDDPTLVTLVHEATWGGMLTRIGACSVNPNLAAVEYAQVQRY